MKWYKINKFLLPFKGFTLVELLVWITISSFLMISVSIMISNGIENITGQKDMIDNSNNQTSFFKNFLDDISSSNTDLYKITGSWLLVKKKRDFKSGGFTYIWTKFLTWAYCLSWSDYQYQNHLIIKNFIPYEGKWSDYFNDIVYQNGLVSVTYNDPSIIDSTITQTGILMWPTGIYEDISNIYIADTKWHRIYSYGAWILTPIVGKWIAWKSLIDNSVGQSWGSVILNSPTGITKVNDWLFISDTLNNRILYYDSSSKKVYEYLSEKDGLSEPTGLYYDTTSNKLYISNSWKGEILLVSAIWSFSSTYNIPFRSGIGNNINNVNISFFSWSISSPVNITWPTNKINISFSWITQGEDLLLTWSSLRYYFSDYSNPETQQNPDCVLTPPYPKYILKSWTTPVKCTMSGTWIVWSLYTRDFSSINSWITINNLVASNFLISGKYYARIQLMNNNTVVWEKYHPFFSSWDDDINTMENNVITVFASWLSYPTGIYKDSSWKIVVNDFFDRWNYFFETDWSFSTGSLIDFDFNNLPTSKSDRIFESPIEKIDILQNGNLITFSWSYYNNFSCFDWLKKGETNFHLKKYIWN